MNGPFDDLQRYLTKFYTTLTEHYESLKVEQNVHGIGIPVTELSISF